MLQTLAGAYFRGYKTIVPADATATFLVGTQEGGLEYFTRCYDSRVTTTESVWKSPVKHLVNRFSDSDNSPQVCPLLGMPAGFLLSSRMAASIKNRRRLAPTPKPPNMQAFSRLLFFQSRFVEGEDFSTIMRVAFAVDIVHVRFHGRF